MFAEEPDYAPYPEGMAGFTGFDLQQVVHWTLQPAMRVRIGQRDLYKTSVALLPSGELLATPCYPDEEDIFRTKVYGSGPRWRPGMLCALYNAGPNVSKLTIPVGAH